jgi:hypothetical protein
LACIRPAISDIEAITALMTIRAMLVLIAVVAAARQT